MNLDRFAALNRAQLGRLHLDQAGNLRAYFDGIPDTEILAKLAGLPSKPPQAAPLLLEGVLALEDPDTVLPYRASRLDYRRSWTIWNDVANW